MKKNIMMRTASGLLIAVLLTTSIISGTLAKYTTSGSSTDTARVAKFGVTVTGTGDAFKTSYATHDTTYTGDVTVSSTDRVVAPGTSGSLGGFTISGTPEVAVRVTYALNTTNTSFNNWTVTTGTDAETGDAITKFYCPIIITVGTTPICGLSYDNPAAFITAINNAVTVFSADYAPGTNLATTASTPSITWAWIFDDNTTGAPAGQNDAYDTQLGNAANPATISLEVTATVTQID